MLTLDLRWQKELEPGWAKFYHQSSRELRGPFITWCNDFLEKRDELLWYITTPFSRDVLQSSIFHQLVCLEALKTSAVFLKKHTAVDIIVDSPAILIQLKEWLKKEKLDLIISVKINPRRPSKFSFIKASAETLIHWILVKLLLKKPSVSGLTNNITLCDTFIFPDHRKERYYPGLWEYLLKNGQHNSFFFVPSLVSTPLRKLMKVIRDVRNRKENFLMREHFLKLKDLFEAFSKLKNFRNIVVPNLEFRGWTVTELIKEELNSAHCFSAGTKAYLISIFPKRLKENGIKVKKVIDWYENQMIDRAWNKGFHDAFPEAKRYGYQGMLVSDLHLSKYPIDAEINKKYSPDTLLAVGKKVQHELGEFSSKQDISLAPSLRFLHVFNEIQRRPVGNLYLVALPISIYESERILNILAKADDSMNCHWCIRFHPSQDLYRFSALTQKLSSWEISEGSLNEEFSRSQLLISTSSSICYEALAHEIGVILIRTNFGLDFCPFRPDFAPQAWKIVEEASELPKSIDELCRADLHGLRETVLQSYFNRPEEKLLQNFS